MINRVRRLILTSKCGQPTGPIAKCELIVMKLYNGARQDVKTNDREVVDVSPKNTPSTANVEACEMVSHRFDL